jgi:hypothetical protein
MVNPVTRLSESEAVTILSGASLSAGLNLGGRIPTGIYMSAAWTAAEMTFQASPNGVTWYNVQTEAAELSVVVAAGVYVALDVSRFYGVNWLKVRSGTSGAAVNQGADRALTLMLGKPQVDS